MNRRKRRPNYFGWIVFLLVAAFGYYFNQIYLPTQPNPFEATPTPTRSAESFVTDADQLATEGKFIQSIEAYQEAIRSSPQDAALYIAIARVQVLAGKPADAQANAENALLLDPGNALAIAVRAWAANAQGNTSDALRWIEEALQIDPNNGLVHAYYTEILVDSGSFDNITKAIEESKVALALAPDTMEAHRARGILLEVTDNYDEAIREFEQALSYNDNIADLHLRIGLNYRAISAPSQAIDAFTRADVLNPADPYPDLYISRTYAGTGELPKALQYAETAVQNNPVDPRLRGNFGVMYYQNDLWKEAIAQLRLAIFGGAAEDGSPIEGLSLVGNDIRLAEIYYTYGLALARTGQCGEALQIAQEIQSKIPTDETAVFNAGEMIRICEENLANPPASTSTPASAEATSAAPPSTTPTP
ncbi:MAG: tetratricopeptide repeat protein [Anaerolineae bacterium]|nr:tetratricopeptide repeat protein [Anaerolineae bacterium]MBL8105693.1 tetratricopeptide repeat protein [Anaerolineales bacterium]MCC7189684.1 tetratricopeptide repeat protein [Anaerolineales bacterium]